MGAFRYLRVARGSYSSGMQGVEERETLDGTVAGQERKKGGVAICLNLSQDPNTLFNLVLRQQIQPTTFT